MVASTQTYRLTVKENNSRIPPDFAVHWAKVLEADECTLLRMHGGVNNRVYRCGDERRKWIIKGYPATGNGSRDRMRAEVDLLQLASEAAPSYVPRLIHVDEERRCIVMEHIAGKLFREGMTPSTKALEGAVDFFRLLNSKPEDARRTISLNAAEGFLSLREHMANVEERIERMQYSHLPKGDRGQAIQQVSRLKEELEKIHETTDKLIRVGHLADQIRPESRCVSPSDFGFHNAIMSEKGVKFFDFEFAGWDDQSKTAADFLLQPRVPVSWKESTLRGFLREFRKKQDTRRLRVLIKILKLKWICIILNILEPGRMDRLLAILDETECREIVKNRLSFALAYRERNHDAHIQMLGSRTRYIAL